DQFYSADENIVKVLVVAADYIAGPVTSIPQHRRRRPRILPVPEHELWSAHDQFSALAVSNVLVVFVEYAAVRLGQRLPDGLRLVQFRLEVPHMGDGGGFGHAVTLADQDTGQRGKAAG